MSTPFPTSPATHMTGQLAAFEKFVENCSAGGNYSRKRYPQSSIHHIMNPMLDARIIEFGNLSEILKLKVHPSQEKFVAQNSVTVAQCHYEPSGWMRGLWSGDKAIGMIAMLNPNIESPSFEKGDPSDGAFLWRLMIGAEHQRKGYGRAAMRIAVEQTLAWNFSKLYTSVVPGDDTPMPFYEASGMKPTGRMLDKEVEYLLSPVVPTK